MKSNVFSVPMLYDDARSEFSFFLIDLASEDLSYVTQYKVLQYFKDPIIKNEV